MRDPAALALVLALGLTALLALVWKLGVGLPILALTLALLAAGGPWLVARLLGALMRRWRAVFWRREEGVHHAFGGIALHIVDDGTFVWIAGSDVQRVLHTRDAEDVLAARHAGCWQRDERGALLLRVDAVVTHLAAAPSRMDPRTVRLRRYLERDVLFPAQMRRRET
jgi:hypothetical protein